MVDYHISTTMERLFGPGVSLLTFFKPTLFLPLSLSCIANTVYPDRTNRTLNSLIVKGVVGQDHWGQVADLGWEYNAQTHVEYQLPDFWEEQLPFVKIYHFTHAKGWQCPERHGGPPTPKQVFPRQVATCKKIPGCACNEAYQWYDYLDKARAIAKSKAKR